MWAGQEVVEEPGCKRYRVHGQPLQFIHSRTCTVPVASPILHRTAWHRINIEFLRSPLPAANRPESQEPLPESPVVVGTRVRIVANNVGDRTGLVTYVGETNLATGNWVGLELDAEFKGKHNG